MKHETYIFAGLLAAGALLAAGIQFFPSSAAAYVLCPWIYLPCFLYGSRKLQTKKQFAFWMTAWCLSFMVRYWGILAPASQAASIGLTFLGAVVYALPFMIDRLTCYRGSRILSLLLFPFMSASVDYIFEMMNLGSLFSLAQTQFDNKLLLQIVSVTGSRGIVFVLALSASMLTLPLKKPAVSEKGASSRKKRLLCVLVTLAVVFLIHLAGFFRITNLTPAIEAAEELKVGWSGEPVTDDSFFADSSDGDLASNTAYLKKALETAKEKGVSLLMFPEESFYLTKDNRESFIQTAGELAKSYGINVLLPIESDDPEQTDELGSNACLLISSDGETKSDYLKTKLVPFVESPYYTAGDGILPDVTIQTGDVDIRLSYAICFDGDFASYVRTMDDDVDVFADVSWDWAQVDDLHYRIIGLRAVENGLTVVKPTVCGYTTVTDYLGNIRSKTHSDDTGYTGVNTVELPLAKVQTIFHRYGRMIDLVYVWGFAVLMIYLLLLRGKEMEKAVEKTKKPLTRFGEFEFLKAMAIIGLPLIHVMEEALEANMASPALIQYGSAVIGLCAFGPSVFMICMGFGIGGGKTSADSIRRTGIQFLLIGAILNVARWLIPGIIQMLTIHTPILEDIKFCLQSDIYYFVGIFFVFYSFIKQFKVTTARLLLLSIITLTINNMLTPFIQKTVTNSVVGSLLGNIIYVDETSCFPLLSWMIFPTVGIIFGEVLKKNTDEFREVFMRRMLDFSIVFCGAFAFFLWDYKIDILKVVVSPVNDYITDLPNVIFLITLACFLIGLTYYLCKWIGHTGFMAFMLKISAFIIPFYLLQWVLIAWIFYGTAIFGLPEGCFGIPAYLISVVVITCLCIYVSSEHGMKIMKVLIKFTYFKKKRKKTKKAVKKDEK